MMEPLSLLIDEVRGVYIPLEFVQDFLTGDLSDWTGIDSEIVAVIKEGPDSPFYWDAWGELESTATYHEGGRNYKLYLNGGLWLYDTDEVYLLDGL